MIDGTYELFRHFYAASATVDAHAAVPPRALETTSHKYGVPSGRGSRDSSQHQRLYLRLLQVYTSRRKRGLLLSERSACKECERLGQEYAELILSHVNLEERFLSAKLRHDHELAATFVIKLNDVASELAAWV